MIHGVVRISKCMLQDIPDYIITHTSKLRNDNCKCTCDGSRYNEMELDSIINLSIHVLFAILGICLNSLTILVLLRGSKFGKAIKIQLINLAIADLLSSLVAPGFGVI